MSVETRAYVSLLVDSLERKKKVLASLLEKTKRQEVMLTSKKLDADEFEKIISEKEVEIAELNEMDEGFDTIFKRVELEFQTNKGQYREQIIHMQELICEITDLSMAVQGLEKQNREHFKIYLIGKKSEIRESKANNKMASSYYQNMSNQSPLEKSYFFNRKK